MHDFKIVSQMVFICGTWFNVLLSASNFCFHFQAKIIYRGLQSSFVESLVMAKKKKEITKGLISATIPCCYMEN